MIDIRLSVGMLRTTEREYVLVVRRYKYNGRSIVKGSTVKNEMKRGTVVE